MAMDTVGRTGRTGRSATIAGVERLLGAVALLMGALMLVGNAPPVVVAPLIGATFILCGVLCAFGQLPGRPTTGMSAMAIGVILLLPLFGLAAWALLPFTIVAGAALAAFGIMKLT